MAMTVNRRGLASVAALLVCCASVGEMSAQDGNGRRRPDLFAYAANEPLKYDVIRTIARDRAVIKEIGYPSPHGGTVSAFLVVPRGEGPFPVVMYGHWGGGTKSSFLPEALMLADRGVVTFLADAPFARALDSYKAANGPQTREVYIQTVVDMRRAIDLLQRERVVDSSRIGYVGLSFGAQVGAILAGIERRVSAFVLMGGLPSLSSTIANSDRPDLVRLRETIQDKAGFERFVASLAEIDSERFVSGTHAPMLLQFGRYDAAISQADAESLIAAASAPLEVGWYDVGHEFNDLESLNARVGWLGKHLRFTAPCLRLASRASRVRAFA